MDWLFDPLNSFFQQFIELWGGALKALFGSSVSTATDDHTTVLNGGMLQGLPLWLATAIMVGISVPAIVIYYIALPVVCVGVFGSLFGSMLLSVQRKGRVFTRYTLRNFGSGLRVVALLAAFVVSIAAFIGFLMYIGMLILNLLALHQDDVQIVLIVSAVIGMTVFSIIAAGFARVYLKHIKPELWENEREISHVK